MKDNKLVVFITSGKFKGKAIYFNNCNNVRPVKNLIRKILLTWFECIYNESYVLDLFTGTGILGFEFNSRNACYVLILDNNKLVYNNILFNKKRLDVGLNLNVKNIDAYKWLECQIILKFNVIILDPPYIENLLFSCFVKINNIDMFFLSLFIYFEYNTSSILIYLPYNWILLKKGQIGKVYYYLVKRLK